MSIQPLPAVSPDAETPARSASGIARAIRRNWIGLGPDTPLAEAERLMRLARVRSLPVVLGTRLLGWLAYRDVLAAAIAPERPGGEIPATASDLMETPVCGIPPDATRAQAAAAIVRGGRGCVAVVEPGRAGPRLVGIVTETDLLRLAYDAWSAEPV